VSPPVATTAQEKIPAIGVAQSEPLPPASISQSLPPVGKPTNNYDLPSINQKRGAGFQIGAVDEKMLQGGSFDPHATATMPNQKPLGASSGKSFQELLREKRLKAEQDIKAMPKKEEVKEEHKGPTEDEKAERKKRLQAMREQQLKKKNEDRTKQLNEFKEETTTSNDLHAQLLAIDKKTKAKTKVQEIVGLGQDDLQESPEVDRRLELLRQTRKEID